MIRSEGYIAIVSAVLVTTLLLGYVLLAGETGFLGRMSGGQAEAGKSALHAAAGCLDYARFRLALGPYAGSQTLVFGSSTCEILPISVGATSTFLRVSSTVREVQVRRQFILNNELEMVSVSNF